MKYIRVTFHIWQEGEHYVSQCVELDTASCGQTEEEALKNIEEATLLHLNSLEDLGECEDALRERRIPIYRHEIIVEPPVQGDECASPMTIRPAIMEIPAAYAP